MLRMSFPTVLICALILSCFCSRATGLDEKISVIQSPDNITVNEGESAEITCCWTTMTKEIFNVKVGWFKNENRVSAENRLYQKSPSQNCSTLHFTRITPNDTGEYMCKVTQDIPILRECIGNKTHLTVITEQLKKSLKLSRRLLSQRQIQKMRPLWMDILWILQMKAVICRTLWSFTFLDVCPSLLCWWHYFI